MAHLKTLKYIKELSFTFSDLCAILKHVLFGFFNHVCFNKRLFPFVKDFKINGFCRWLKNSFVSFQKPPFGILLSLSSKEAFTSSLFRQKYLNFMRF